MKKIAMFVIKIVVMIIMMVTLIMVKVIIFVILIILVIMNHRMINVVIVDVARRKTPARGVRFLAMVVLLSLLLELILFGVAT